MGKFNFRLNSLLNVKQKIEEQKKIEYGIYLNELEMEKKN